MAKVRRRSKDSKCGVEALLGDVAGAAVHPMTSRAAGARQEEVLELQHGAVDKVAVEGWTHTVVVAKVTDSQVVRHNGVGDVARLQVGALSEKTRLVEPPVVGLLRENDARRVQGRGRKKSPCWHLANVNQRCVFTVGKRVTLQLPVRTRNRCGRKSYPGQRQRGSARASRS